MRLSILGVMLALAGCTYEVRYDSTPPGARVYVDNELVGTTPMTHEMPREGLTSYMLRFELDGHHAESMVVKPVPTGRIVTTTTGGPPPGQVNQQPPPPLPPGRTAYTNEELAGMAVTTFQQSLHAPRRTTRREETEWPDRLSARMRPLGVSRPGSSAVGPVAPSYCAQCGAKLGNGPIGHCGACGNPVRAR